MEKSEIDSPEKAKIFVESAPREWLVEFVLEARKSGHLRLLSNGLDTLPLSHLRRLATAAVDNIEEEAIAESKAKNKPKIVVSE